MTLKDLEQFDFFGERLWISVDRTLSTPMAIIEICHCLTIAMKDDFTRIIEVRSCLAVAQNVTDSIFLCEIAMFHDMDHLDALISILLLAPNVHQRFPSMISVVSIPIFIQCFGLAAK